MLDLVRDLALPTTVDDEVDLFVVGGIGSVYHLGLSLSDSVGESDIAESQAIKIGQDVQIKTEKVKQITIDLNDLTTFKLCVKF